MMHASNTLNGLTYEYLVDFSLSPKLIDSCKRVFEGPEVVFEKVLTNPELFSSRNKGEFDDIVFSVSSVGYNVIGKRGTEVGVFEMLPAEKELRRAGVDSEKRSSVVKALASEANKVAVSLDSGSCFEVSGDFREVEVVGVEETLGDSDEKASFHAAFDVCRPFIASWSNCCIESTPVDDEVEEVEVVVVMLKFDVSV